MNDEVEKILDDLLHLKAQRSALSELIQAREDELGEAMGAYKAQVGSHTLKRHKRKPRTRNWDSGGLLRIVQDSLVIDKETGEITEESAVEKLVAVFGCRGYDAKLSELERRGISFDEFCEVEEVPGWQVEVR